jgi:hypothetical protein
MCIDDILTQFQLINLLLTYMVNSKFVSRWLLDEARHDLGIR